MKETEKLKLKLPETSDWADITALNDNFQALDSWLEQLKSDIIAKLNDTPAKEHTHTKKDITDFPTSLPASDVHDWAKQPDKPVYTAGEVEARPNTWTPNLPDVAFLGENPVKSTADDTTDQWCRIGSGYAWYCASGLLTGQPAQYGFLLNYVNGSDVFQIWNSQNAGPMYTRSGNANGWGGSWKRYYTEEEINSKLSGYATAAQLNEVKKAAGGWKLLSSFSETITSSSGTPRDIIPTGINIAGIKALKQVTTVKNLYFKDRGSNYNAYVAFGWMGPVYYGVYDYNDSQLTNCNLRSEFITNLKTSSLDRGGTFKMNSELTVNNSYILTFTPKNTSVGMEIAIDDKGNITEVKDWTGSSYDAIKYAGSVGYNRLYTNQPASYLYKIQYSIELYGLF